jgi:hypothetical protein
VPQQRLTFVGVFFQLRRLSDQQRLVEVGQAVEAALLDDAQ